MIKNCLYCQIPFEAKTSAKYCEEHRNKICRKCGQLKKGVNSEDHRALCNKCESDRTKAYLKRKREQGIKPGYSKEKKRASRKKYCAANPEKIKAYYHNNKATIKRKAALRYRNNPAIILNRNKKWRQENKTRFKELRKRATDKFRKTNPHIVAWRNMLHRVLKYQGIKKVSRTFELCGYTAEELRENIESKFLPGMSWQNYGKWHIDHVKAVTKFEINTHVSIVNALSNLQPLWRVDNIRKKNK